jgi:hypothetical protein
MSLKVIKNKKEALSLTHGTSLKGYLPGVTYNELVEAFGEPLFKPEDSGDGKVNFEWVFKFEGEVFTIYDWKVEEEYARFMLGKSGEESFHVGGKSYMGDFEDEVYRKLGYTVT